MRRTRPIGRPIGLLAIATLATLAALAPPVPVMASCVSAGTLLATSRASAIAFVGSRASARDGVVTMTVARPLLGDLGGRIRIDLSHLQPSAWPREDAWSVVLLVDTPPDADGVHRPASECDLVIARTGTWAATQLLDTVTVSDLPPTDAPAAAPSPAADPAPGLLALAGLLGLALGRARLRRRPLGPDQPALS